MRQEIYLVYIGFKYEEIKCMEQSPGESARPHEPTAAHGHARLCRLRASPRLHGVSIIRRPRVSELAAWVALL